MIWCTREGLGNAKEWTWQVWRTCQLDKRKPEISECNKNCEFKRNALIVVTTTDHFLPTTVKQNRLEWRVSLRRVFYKREGDIHVRIAPYTNPSHRPVAHRTGRFLDSSSFSSIRISVNYCTVHNGCLSCLLQDDSS